MVILEDTRQQDGKYIIYAHVSPTGKIYIGRTSKTLEMRSGKCGQKYKNNKDFYSDIKQYGWDNFTHEILEVCDTEEESMELEIKYIQKYDSCDPQKGYNKSIGGYPCNKGLTEEEKKRRQRLASKRWIENNKERFLATNRKRESSPEYKKKKNEYNKTEKRRRHRTEYMKKYRELNREEYNRKRRERARRKRENTVGGYETTKSETLQEA